MLLAIVAGPIIWLMFTDDGRRRTDVVMLTLFGGEEMNLRLDTLASTATEQAIREFLPALEWDCAQAPGPFGSRACATKIASFNGTPAYSSVIYTDGDYLQAIKVVYRPRYHGWLKGELRRQLGEPAFDPGDVLRWTTPRGLVLLPSVIAPEEPEPSLMWIAAERAAQGGMPILR